MNLYIGSDHAGFQLKNELMKEFKMIDVGTDSTDSCHYPIYA